MFGKRSVEMSREEHSTALAPAGAIPSLFASWASWCSRFGDAQLGSACAETTVGFYRLALRALWSLLVSLAVASGGSRSKATRLAVLVVEGFGPVGEDVGRVFAGWKRGVDYGSLPCSGEAKQMRLGASGQKSVERPGGFAAAEACYVRHLWWIPDRKAQSRCPVVPVVALAVAAQYWAAAGRKDWMEVQLSCARRDAARVTFVGGAEPVAAAAAAAVVVAVAAAAVDDPAAED